MGFFDNEPKKKMGCLVTSMNQTLGSRIYPITIPMIPKYGIGMHQTMMVMAIVMAA